MRINNKIKAIRIARGVKPFLLNFFSSFSILLSKYTIIIIRDVVTAPTEISNLSKAYPFKVRCGQHRRRCGDMGYE